MEGKRAVNWQTRNFNKLKTQLELEILTRTHKPHTFTSGYDRKLNPQVSCILIQAFPLTPYQKALVTDQNIILQDIIQSRSKFCGAYTRNVNSRNRLWHLIYLYQ